MEKHPLSNLFSDLEIGVSSITVVGLGYVGRPLFEAFLRMGFNCVGYDNSPRVVEEVSRATKQCAFCKVTSDPTEAFHISPAVPSRVVIVTVPTPVKHGTSEIDLECMVSATKTIAKHASGPLLLVYESTAYPGITREMVEIMKAENPRWAAFDQLFYGYSPERITPGDTQHELHNTNKIVSGCDDMTLEILRKLYKVVVWNADVYPAPSVEVAEAAKVVENVQRDVNIALMNELAMNFHTLGVDFREVLKAAGTKWNFGKYSPGLVGGHCIAVDPWYLEHKFQEKGVTSNIIRTARAASDRVPAFIVEAIKHRLHGDKKAPLLVSGLTYKPDVCDWRDSRALELAHLLTKEFPETQVEDEQIQAHPDFQNIKKRPEFVGLNWFCDNNSLACFKALDAIILAVPHYNRMNNIYKVLDKEISPPALVVDVCGVLDKKRVYSTGHNLWTL